MSRSSNIGKVAGTVVRLHITFVLLLAWIFVSNCASSGIAEMMTLAMLQKDRVGGAPLVWRSRPNGMR